MGSDFLPPWPFLFVLFKIFHLLKSNHFSCHIFVTPLKKNTKFRYRTKTSARCLNPTYPAPSWGLFLYLCWSPPAVLGSLYPRNLAIELHKEWDPWPWQCQQMLHQIELHGVISLSHSWMVRLSGSSERILFMRWLSQNSRPYSLNINTHQVNL